MRSVQVSVNLKNQTTIILAVLEVVRLKKRYNFVAKSRKNHGRRLKPSASVNLDREHIKFE